MYTEQDFSDITRQLRKRFILAAIPAVLGVAGIVASVMMRIEWLTEVLTLITGFYCLFTYCMALSPVRAYRTHLDDVLHGRVRQMTGSFKEMDETAVLREGVMYYPLMLSVGNPDDPEDDRLLYYDANLPRPDWKVGEMLEVTIHDKAMGNWKRIDGQKTEEKEGRGGCA